MKDSIAFALGIRLIAILKALVSMTVLNLFTLSTVLI
jgi:hypothetical protein